MTIAHQTEQDIVSFKSGTESRSFVRWSSAVLIIEFLLMFAPLIILGNAINWPASLDEPASVNLPLILEQANSVNLGYFIYLIYSILITPIAVIIYQVLKRESQANTLLQIGLGFAIASTVLRVLGIIRWLIPMPVLAQYYVDPTSTDATRESITIMYDMLNAYAGSVGEILGVGLFAALWVGVTSYVMLQDKQHPTALGLFGIATAIALAGGLLELIDLDTGALLFINVAMLQFWWLFIALILVFRPNWFTETTD